MTHSTSAKPIRQADSRDTTKGALPPPEVRSGTILTT